MNSRLAELYRKTFEYAQLDPEVSLVFARKFAEAFCLDILRDADGSRRVRPRSLEDLIHELSSRSSFPAHLLPPLRSVQFYGNAGSHEQTGATAGYSHEYVRPCLNAVAILRAWRQESVAERKLEQAIEHDTRSPLVVSIADSRLSVIRAIHLAWDLEATLADWGFETHHLAYPWSDRLLQDISSGTIDIAIYNHARSERFGASMQRPNLSILGSFGHSMGGRNFYMLARRDSRWTGLSYEGFRAALKNATIALPYSSDIAENIHIALDLDLTAFDEREVQLVHIPASSGLEIFQMNRDLIVSAGQNIRILAERSEEYVEILNVDGLPSGLRPILIRRAENCLVVNSRLEEKINSNLLFKNLYSNFHRNWRHERRFYLLLNQLSSNIELDNIQPDDAEYIARRILYDSYRIGDPI